MNLLFKKQREDDDETKFQEEKTMKFIVLLSIISYEAFAQGATSVLPTEGSVPQFGPWSDMDLMAKMLFLLVAFNFLLSGISKFLDVIKDVTVGDGDNKALKAINNVSIWIQRIIDWFSANRQHK